MKSRNYFILLFSTLFSLTFILDGCDEPANLETQNFPEQADDTLKLDVGFSYRSRQFDFEGKAYVCLFDLVTFRKVKVYDEKLNWIKTFSLDPFIEEAYNFSDFEMVTMDSILLLTDDRTSLLISANIKTQEKQIVSLNSLLPFPDVDASLEFKSSLYRGFRHKNELVFTISPSVSSLRALYPNSDQFQLLRKYDSINKSLPAYVSLSKPFHKVPKIKEIEYSDAFDKLFADAYFLELNYQFVGNNKIISVSRYQNYIDVYDLKSKKSIKKTIKSEFTDLGVPVRKWEDLEKMSGENWNMAFNSDLSKSGQIYRMFYDNKKKQYSFLIWYSEKSKPEGDSNASPFIWQVYDENFVLLEEREHAPTSLAIGLAIGTKNGIYFPYYNKKTYDPYKAILVRYSF